MDSETKCILIEAARSHLRKGTVAYVFNLKQANETLTYWDNAFTEEEAAKILRELAYEELSELHARIDQIFKDS